MQTVLVVDDEAVVLHVVSRMLRRLGYEVLTAEDGCRAVEIYGPRADAIDCVIVDLAMPQMDGYQTFLALRQVRPEACVILASGFEEDEILSRFAGQGFAGYIQKPFSLEILEQKLDEVLRGQPAR